jgi:hypothetical protein
MKGTLCHAFFNTAMLIDAAAKSVQVAAVDDSHHLPNP